MKLYILDRYPKHNNNNSNNNKGMVEALHL